MDRARAAEAWAHTSAVMALVANCHRDPTRRPRPFAPAEFDPTAPARARRPRRPSVAALTRAVLAEAARRRGG